MSWRKELAQALATKLGYEGEVDDFTAMDFAYECECCGMSHEFDIDFWLGTTPVHTEKVLGTFLGTLDQLGH